MAGEENQIKVEEIEDELRDILSFDPTKKKKKKKLVRTDPLNNSIVDDFEKDEARDDDFEKDEARDKVPIDITKKKKKKKSVHTDLLDDNEENITVNNLDEDEKGDGSEKDYEYEELLRRVYNFNILRVRDKNPELGGGRPKIVLAPPQLRREGPRRTVFVNFMDLSKKMHRQPEHFMNFLLAEMGTSGSIDGRQRLVVKGRCESKNVEPIIRRYVNDYVKCNDCTSSDTILWKEKRVMFLRCDKCGSGRSVASIKTGFVARVCGQRNART